MSYFNEDQRGVESWEAEKLRKIRTLEAENAALRARLDLADEVANDLEWALSWLETYVDDRCDFRRRQLKAATDRLAAYRASAGGADA